MDEETQEQRATVDLLAKEGFTVTRVCNNYGGEPGVFVLMSRKRGYTTHLAQVEADGSVNGGDVKGFIASLKKG